jgi:hypothetical protein
LETVREVEEEQGKVRCEARLEMRKVGERRWEWMRVEVKRTTMQAKCALRTEGGEWKWKSGIWTGKANGSKMTWQLLMGEEKEQTKWYRWTRERREAKLE